MYVEETILGTFPQKNLTLHNFCIQNPNVALFDALNQQEI